MKQLPEMKHSWADMYNLIKVDVKSHILVTAIKLNVFDVLNEPINAADVAEKMGWHSRNTELFLNGLAGMEIVIKKNGLFSNTEKSAECLVTSSPCYLGAFFLHVRNWHDSLKANLEDSIKNGPPSTTRDVSDGSIWAESARVSAAYQYCGPAQALAGFVAAQPEFPQMKKMLDLGGGSGFFTQAIVAAHPSMTGVIFEQPPVAAVTRRFIAEYEAEERVSVKEGSYLTDQLGDSYDFIFASATLNFFKDRLDELFAKVYDALSPGGIFMTHQDGVYGERTKPVDHITEFLSAELYGMDFAIPRGLIAEAMLRAGFQSVRSFTNQFDFGEMDIDIGRKAL